MPASPMIELPADLKDIPVHSAKIPTSFKMNIKPKDHPVESSLKKGDIADLDATGEKPLSKCAKAILGFLAGYDREFSKPQIGTAIGYSPTSSSFQNAMGELNTRGFIIRGKGIRANRAKMSDIAASIGPVKKLKINISTFRDKLTKCEAEIYDVVLAQPRHRFSKEALAAATASRYSSTSSSFQNSVGKLNTLELIRRENGHLFLNPELAELL
jgi:hypothetical protein